MTFQYLDIILMEEKTYFNSLFKKIQIIGQDFEKNYFNAEQEIDRAIKAIINL